MSGFLGVPSAGRAVADLLGVGTPSVYKAAQRGRVTSRQWDSRPLDRRVLPLPLETHP